MLKDLLQIMTPKGSPGLSLDKTLKYDKTAMGEPARLPHGFKTYPVLRIQLIQ
jgi:hypothetical protein